MNKDKNVYLWIKTLSLASSYFNHFYRSESYVERGKQILKALDPEKYEQIKGLVKAIKGTKNKCSGTKCVDDTGDEQNGSDASDDNG